MFGPPSQKHGKRYNFQTSPPKPFETAGGCDTDTIGKRLTVWTSPPPSHWKTLHFFRPRLQSQRKTLGAATPNPFSGFHGLCKGGLKDVAFSNGSGTGGPTTPAFSNGFGVTAPSVYHLLWRRGLKKCNVFRVSGRGGLNNQAFSNGFGVTASSGFHWLWRRGLKNVTFSNGSGTLGAVMPKPLENA